MVEHRHRRRRRGRRRSCASGVDKIAFTGSTAVGKEIQRALAGTGTGLTLELGGKSANIVLRGRRARPGGRGHHRGDLLQPGPRLLRGLAPAAAGERGRRGRRASCGARMERLRVGDPLDKNTDVGAINSAAQLARIDDAGRRGRARGRDAALDHVRAARDRLLVPAHPVPRRRARQPDRGRGDLRAGRCRSRRSARRRRRSSARTTPRTAWPRACGPTTARRPSRSRPPCARASSGRTRTTASIRRPRSAATRRAASVARAGPRT